MQNRESKNAKYAWLAANRMQNGCKIEGFMQHEMETVGSPKTFYAYAQAQKVHTCTSLVRVAKYVEHYGWQRP